MQTADLGNVEFYEQQRRRHSNIQVLGGIRFKYKRETGNPLEVDLAEGVSRCEAIVTTGDGTGVETPIDKLRMFKKYLVNFPLIVGAGVTAQNAYEQLRVADGAIVGSYFKPDGDTQEPVDRKRVRDFMDVVRQARS